MKRLVLCLTIFFLLLVGFSQPTPTYAADIRTGDTVTVGSASAGNTPLKNLYLFGQTIEETSPVQGDIISAGNTLTLDGAVSGDIFAAGRTLIISSPVGNSLHVAGQDIIIKGTIKNDLVVAGSSLLIDKNASIGGDVMFAGKSLRVDGPIGGKLLVAGSDVILNASVHEVKGHINKLELRENAVVDGPLTYTSPQKADMSPQAKVLGKTTFTQKQSTKNDTKEQLIQGNDIYKLIIEILLSLLLVYFFATPLLAVFTAMLTDPLSKGFFGFGFLILFPLAAFFGLILLWLGVSAFLFYGLVLILTTFVTKLFTGWYLLSWYEKRSKKTYTLDWKAAVLGPLVLFIVGLVPVLGWLLAALIFLVALGSLVKMASTLVKSPNYKN